MAIRVCEHPVGGFLALFSLEVGHKFSISVKEVGKKSIYLVVQEEILKIS